MRNSNALVSEHIAGHFEVTSRGQLQVAHPDDADASNGIRFTRSSGPLAWTRVAKADCDFQSGVSLCGESLMLGVRRLVQQTECLLLERDLQLTECLLPEGTGWHLVRTPHFVREATTSPSPYPVQGWQMFKLAIELPRRTRQTRPQAPSASSMRGGGRIMGTDEIFMPRRQP